MKIDDIEKSLNKFEVEPEKVLDAILNTVAKNQAILETLLELQISNMVEKDPNLDFETVAEQLAKVIDVRLAKIQKQISSKF